MANLGFCGALVASRLIFFFFFTLKRDSESEAMARSKDQGRAALRGPCNARWESVTFPEFWLSGDTEPSALQTRLGPGLPTALCREFCWPCSV